MALSCDLHNSCFFFFFSPHAIFEYWVTLSPNKLISSHLTRLIGGEQPLGRPAHATGKPHGLIKTMKMTLNQKAVPVAGGWDSPPPPPAGGCLVENSRQELWGGSPSSRRIPGGGIRAASLFGPGHCQARIEWGGQGTRGRREGD